MTEENRKPQTQQEAKSTLENAIFTHWDTIGEQYKAENIAKEVLTKAGIDPDNIIALPEFTGGLTITNINPDDIIESPGWSTITNINHPDDGVVFIRPDIESVQAEQKKITNYTLNYDRKTRMKHLPPHIGVDYFEDLSFYTGPDGSIKSSLVYKPYYYTI